SPADAETCDAYENTNSGDQGQAGSDLGRTLESRPLIEQVVMDEDQAGPNPGESHRALAGLDPEPTPYEGSNKLNRDSLSSMKNLEDAYAVGDQFINDKSTKDEPKKPNVEAKVVYMVTVLFYQASSLVPPLSTPVPVINLSPLKPASSTAQAPIFIETTTTTLPPPPQQQSTTESEVFNLELRDLPHKIDEVVRESVREAVHVALQAPLQDRFRELPEADMKEILYQCMFETDTYMSLPEHVALYEALEASMKHIPMPCTANISDLEGSDSAYLLKIKQRPEWLKLILDDERLATLKPSWVIPSSHIPDAYNNWANALATTYQALAENSLLEKTRDMRTFIHWYCQQMGKTELTQADFEGQAYEVVKAFYPDVVYLQFQMEEHECHKMLTD
nr:hypothetical protein [Tanacetum cinerariifolium]